MKELPEERVGGECDGTGDAKGSRYQEVLYTEICLVPVSNGDSGSEAITKSLWYLKSCSTNRCFSTRVFVLLRLYQRHKALQGCNNEAGGLRGTVTLGTSIERGVRVDGTDLLCLVPSLDNDAGSS